MKSITSLFSVLVSVIFCGCGPIKGYPGPEISSDQLVTISVANANSGTLSDSSIDGTLFAYRAVRVLVGRHKIKTLLSRRGAPENCGMEREFDNCYSCREARETSCRENNRDNPEICSSLWQSEEMHVMCDYHYSSFECGLDAMIVEPGRYVITVLPESDDVRLTGPNLNLPFQCTPVGTSLHRERMR
jgi:hypothetical protein